MLKVQLGFIILLSITTLAFADMTIPMYFTAASKPTEIAGTIIISETPYGLLFTPKVQGIATGIHGFHVHMNPSCDENGMSAGDHFDPHHTNKHLGPYNNGHLGDLPALYVNEQKEINLPVLAPRIKHIAQIKNHALMIHEGGDNYANVPKAGGGGNRMICGVIK